MTRPKDTTSGEMFPPEPLKSWQGGATKAPSHWIDDQQIQQVERVGGRIGLDIITFLRHRVSLGAVAFRMETLRQYIETTGNASAPDSAGRILRLLRQNGIINYKVVNRRQSLYEVVEL